MSIPTISPKSIKTYNDIIKDMADNYTPTDSYWKDTTSPSGVYIKKFNDIYKFSFHYSTDYPDQHGVSVVIRRRIHLTINIPYPKTHVIHFILKHQDGNLVLEPREESKKIYEIAARYPDIVAEINNIHEFLKQFSSTPLPNLGDPIEFPSLNKYPEYKLKYLILKNFINKK